MSRDVDPDDVSTAHPAQSPRAARMTKHRISRPRHGARRTAPDRPHGTAPASSPARRRAVASRHERRDRRRRRADRLLRDHGLPARPPRTMRRGPPPRRACWPPSDTSTSSSRPRLHACAPNSRPPPARHSSPRCATPRRRRVPGSWRRAQRGRGGPRPPVPRWRPRRAPARQAAVVVLGVAVVVDAAPERSDAGRHLDPKRRPRAPRSPPRAGHERDGIIRRARHDRGRLRGRR